MLLTDALQGVLKPSQKWSQCNELSILSILKGSFLLSFGDNKTVFLQHLMCKSIIQKTLKQDREKVLSHSSSITSASVRCRLTKQ